MNTPVSAGVSCADGDACNGAELCDGAGTCQAGTVPSVDDGNPCTADSCDPVAGVVNTPVSAGVSCADGDACNGAELCDGAGACQAGTAPTVDDGNPCTADSCDPATGVVNTPVSAGVSCADGDACNGAEVCDGAGACQAGTAPTVDDGNPCTADSCDPVAGVLNTPVSAGVSCADGDACNGAELCDGAGACQAGTAPSVDDGNPCTADSCDPAAGVVNTPVSAGVSCADSDACNGAELCDGAGACQAGTAPSVDDGNPCTADSCDPATGVSNTPVSAGVSCADGDACNGAELCDGAGACQAGTAPSVDDGNPCTADSCDPATGVVNTPVSAGVSCADGDACNGAELCDGAGACQAGTAPSVDDGNPCTADSCDPVAGVVNTPVSAGVSCADGDACNGAELCDGAGACQSGIPLVIDDGNPCTADSCDPVAGVLNTPVSAGASCADGDACNGAETCDGAGTCQSGTPLVVDDGNPCTADSCDPLTGLVSHPPSNAGQSCQIDLCTVGECDGAGVCAGATPPPDDGDSCTRETCDPLTGISVTTCEDVDPSVVTNIYDGTSWIYTGANPIQIGVDPATIEVHRASVIRGFVSDRAGNPLSGARVEVLDHPEFGYTQTQTNGEFDMVVNGGGTLMVEFSKDGYFNAQRTIDLPWGEFGRTEDAVLIQPDPVVTQVDLTQTSEAFVVATSSVVSDADGQRTATLLFPMGTEAQLVHADGTVEPQSVINVRATEYTVGENGPDAMPAPLPFTSAYTYAVEYSTDESIAAGAQAVEFSNPVVAYVDNFLDFPAGTVVPVGSYDAKQRAWVPEESGVVLDVISIGPGGAEIDVTGDGNVNTGPELEALSINAEELIQLAALHEPGDSVWRHRVSHFSPWDLNWGIIPPGDAVRPPDPDGGDDTGPDPDENCEQIGSIIECQSLTLRERVPVAGTPYSLNYGTHRVRGREEKYKLNINLSDNPPNSLRRIAVQIDVAGRRFVINHAPATNLNQLFVWDGLDAYGRRVQGSRPATVTVFYFYQGVYGRTSRFGGGAGSFISGDPARQSLIFGRVWNTRIGGWDARSVGLGGWTLDQHHLYDPVNQQIQFGDGSRRTLNHEPAVMEELAVITSPSLGDSTPEGGVYYSASSRIGIVNPDKSIQTVAGTGVSGYSGDGGPALNAQLNFPTDIARAPDGSIYIADRRNHRIRKVDPNGVITTVAGNGTAGYSGDDGPAVDAQLNFPRSVTWGPDQSLYIADQSNRRVRRIDPGGVISTVAGTGSLSSIASADGLPATETNMHPDDIALGPDGSLYIADSVFDVVLRVRPDGIAQRVATDVPGTLFADGQPANSAGMYNFNSVSVSSSGGVLFAGTGRISSSTIARVVAQLSPSGELFRIAGANAQTYQVPGFPVKARGLAGSVVTVRQGPLGTYFAHGNNITFAKSVLPGLGLGETLVASEDSDEAYLFDFRGRHLETRNSKTGAVIHQFAYQDGLLSEVTDAYANTTSIQRDSNGAPLSVTGPYGQQTSLALDPNGYLSQITNPDNETVTMSYTPGGLLLSMTDPRGALTTMTYDSSGRLSTDTSADSATQSYTPSGDRYSWQVDRLSGEGRATRYEIETSRTDDEVRTNTFADGTQATMTKVTDAATRESNLADGTRIIMEELPDPRFGMDRPVTNATTTLPSGLQRVVNVSRTISGGSGLDPFDYFSETTDRLINGKRWRERYTRGTRTRVLTSPDSRTLTTVEDDLGRIISRSRPGILPVTFSYDTQGRLETIQQGTRSITSDYFTSGTQNGYLESLTNPEAETTSFSRDAVGRPLTETYADAQQTTFAWDDNGNLTLVQPPGKPGHTQFFNEVNEMRDYTPPALVDLSAPGTTYNYNLDRQVTLEQRPGGVNIQTDYDSAGRVDLVTLPTGTIDYEYYPVTPCPTCAPGRLMSASGPDAVSVNLEYDGRLLTKATWSGDVSGEVAKTYDDDFRIVTETVQAGASSSSAHFGYDEDNLITCVSGTACSPAAPDALQLSHDDAGRVESATVGTLTETYTYNAYGELATHTVTQAGSQLFSATYDSSSGPRDQLGRIQLKSETVLGTSTDIEYSYDDRQRLIGVAENGVLTQSYDYDANGNRELLTTPSASTAGTYDDQDRLLSYGDFSYTYAPNGELESKTETTSGDTTDYVYDTRGALLSVALPNATLIEYTTDPSGARVGKSVNGTLTQSFLYKDSLRIAAELDATGNIVSRFHYVGAAHSPDTMVSGGQTYRFIKDQLGSPRLVVNIADGTVAQQLEYDAFGVVTLDTNPGFQPFGFAGGLYDADTGLVRFGARDYDAQVGRWTAKDPIRWEGDQANFYVYVNGDPVNIIDPSGKIAPIALGLGILGAGVFGGVASAVVGGGGAEGFVKGFTVGFVRGSALGAFAMGGWFGAATLYGTSVALDLLFETEGGEDPGGIADTAAGLFGERACEAAAGPFVGTAICPVASESLKRACEEQRKEQ